MAGAVVRTIEPGSRTLRWGQLVLGLMGFAVSISLMIRSGLGLGPWDAFHMGIYRLTGISVGNASILVGVAVVACSLLVRVRPGAGTLANMVLIGAFLDLLLPRVPAAHGWGWQLAYYAVGIGLAGFSTGMYIAPGLGKGPRDGLMVGLAERTGWPVRRVRTLIELNVLLFGWLMGGPVGVGTILFTLSIGPAAQWGMELFGVIPTARPTLPHPASDAVPAGGGSVLASPDVRPIRSRRRRSARRGW